MEGIQPLVLACPCCKRNCASEHLSSLREVEHDIRVHGIDPWVRPEGWAVLAALSSELQWACSRCVEDGTAIKARPNLQNFCDFNPYFAYFDVTLVCQDCEASFCFRDSEQLHWYEVLRFLVQSRPKQCLDCRRLRRAKSNSQWNR
jgi:uncharacterized protein YbaR (Trm112 family)